MGRWDEYINQVKTRNPSLGKEIAEIEELVDISSILRHRREDLGLTQKDLASRCVRLVR